MQPQQEIKKELDSKPKEEECIQCIEKIPPKKDYDRLYQMYYLSELNKHFAKKLGPNPSPQDLENTILHKDEIITETLKKVIALKAQVFAEHEVQQRKAEEENHRKILETGRSQAESLRVVKRIVKERIDFMDSNLSILQSENNEEVAKYLKREFQVEIKANNFTQLLQDATSVYQVASFYYKKLLNFLELDKLTIDNSGDFIYHLQKTVQHFSRTNQLTLKLLKSEHEQSNEILRQLKPYLSESYHEFQSKFMDVELRGISRPEKIKIVMDSEVTFMKSFIEKFNEKFNSDYYKYLKEEENILLKEVIGMLEDILNKFYADIVSNDQPNGAPIASKKTIEEFDARSYYQCLYQAMKLFNTFDKDMQQKKAQALKDLKKNAKPSIESKEANHKNPKHEQNDIDQKTITETSNQIACETDNEAAQLLTNFKQEKLSTLLAWQMECQRRAEIKQAMLKYLEQDSKEKADDDHEITESKEIQEFEALQLCYLFQNIRNHFDTLENLMSGFSLTFSELVNLVNAASKDLIEPQQYMCFNLIKQQGGSHFRAYIPNTRIDWKAAMEKRRAQDYIVSEENIHTNKQNNNVYVLTPSQMSRVFSWDHSREIHSGGPLSIKAIKRIRDGFLRSGITPERIRQAQKMQNQKVVFTFSRA